MLPATSSPMEPDPDTTDPGKRSAGRPGGTLKTAGDESSVTRCTTPSSDWRLQLLGGALLVRADVDTLSLERRDAALLTLLALDGPQTRARVAALLWPDSEPRRGGNNLRQRLFRMRRAAGRDLVVGDRTLHLATGLGHDLGRPSERVIEHARALGGELLGTIDYSDCGELGVWVETARQQWRTLRRQLLADNAARLEAGGSIAQALEFAEQLVLDDPTAEHAHRRVMRLHYLRGDRSAGLVAYRRCRQQLADLLNTLPGEETLQLAQTIEHSATLPTTASAPTPVAVLRPPHLVGRAAQWAAIEHAWCTGKVVLLTGEPGMGKSRLVGDLAVSKGVVTVARGRPGDANVPYSTLARWLHDTGQRLGWTATPWIRNELSRLLPELEGMPAGTLHPTRLHRAIDAAVLAWVAGGLAALMVDDLQFMDSASMDWLLAWMGPSNPHDRAEALPVLLAMRRHERPQALSHWMAESAERVTELALPPLDHAAMVELLSSLRLPGIDGGTWGSALLRHTGGVPMYVLETLTEWLATKVDTADLAAQRLPVPASIGQLIARRLSQLSPGALRLARVAALAGIDFDVGLAAEVLGHHALDLAGDWHELEQAHVLRDQALAHDLIREAALRGIPEPIARHLHEALARCLASRQGEPARVAQHWFEAGKWSQAGSSFLLAATVAQRASQRRLEGELAGQAAHCFAKAGNREQELDAREQQHLAGRFIERQDVQVKRAREMLAVAMTPRQRGVALESLAATLIEDFRDEEIVAAAHEARLIARSLGDAGRELAAARIESRALSRMNRIDEALQLVQHHLPGVRHRLTDPHGVRMVAEFACTLMSCDRVDEAAGLFEESLAAATQLQDWGLCQECHEHMAWVHDYRGHIDRSIRSYEDAQALAPRLGAELQPARIGRAILGRRYKEVGRFSEALSLLEKTLDEQRDGDEVAIIGMTQADLAGLFLWLGQPGRARGVLEVPRPDAPPMVRRSFHLAAAQIAAWNDRPCLAELEQALSWARREGGEVYRLAIECEMAQHLPPHEAVALADGAWRRASSLGLGLLERPLLIAKTDALRRAGHLTEAHALAQEWAPSLQEWPIGVLYPPMCGWVAYQVFEAAGDAAASHQALRGAVRWIEDTALPQVPAAFRESFLQRNPVNRTLLTTAGRVLGD